MDTLQKKIMPFILSLKFSSGRILKKLYFKISIDKNIDFILKGFPLIYKIYFKNVLALINI